MHMGKRYGDQFQISYITRDMDAALAHAESELGIAEFNLSEPTVEVLCYGKPETLVVKAALANYNGRQFEIIQPVSGPTHVYTCSVDLDSHILNFHHIAIAIPGPYSEWQKLVSEVRESGDEFAFLSPEVPGEEPMLSFCYVDTRKRWGHFTEYLWADVSLKGIAVAPHLLD